MNMSKMDTITHSKYGDVQINQWIPLYYHRTNLENDEHIFGINTRYEIMLQDNKSTPITIRNKSTKRILKSTKGAYSLSFGNTNEHFNETHLALSSAFPDVTPEYTIDHINDDFTDNRILNLEWMPLAQNCRKGQQKSTLVSKQNGGKRGRYINIRQPDNQHPKDREKSVVIGTFRSIEKCAKFIIDNIIQRSNKPKTKTVASKISRALKRPELKAYGYYFDNVEVELEDEEWKPYPYDTSYSVSTHGRVRNKHGIISHQFRSRDGSPYKTICINGKRKYIHRLVWETFHSEIPTNLDVMHDDTAPRNSDRTHRNWLCDLSLGTRSKNMKSFHKHKDNFVIDDTNTVINEVIPDVSKLPKVVYPNNQLGELMKNPPIGIQYYKANTRGSKYILSRRFSITGKDISSSGSKQIGDEEKFIEILKIYQSYCIPDKQDKRIMSIDTTELEKFIPTA